MRSTAWSMLASSRPAYPACQDAQHGTELLHVRLSNFTQDLRDLMGQRSHQNPAQG